MEPSPRGIISLAPLFWAQWSIEAEVGAGKSEARLRGCAFARRARVMSAMRYCPFPSQLRNSQPKHPSGFLKVGAGFQEVSPGPPLSYGAS